MQEYIKTRCVEMAKYIIETNCTCRECAKKFSISKTTVHLDMRKRLVDIDILLYKKVEKVLDLHKKEAHLRGGLAIREKNCYRKRFFYK